MKNLARILIILAVGMCLLGSCNKPSLIGSGILPDEDNVDILFMDTLTITTCTVTEDSVRVYDPDFRAQLRYYLCGNLQDANFGDARSEIYSQFRLATTDPNLENTKLDSIVLALSYSETGHVGELQQPQTYFVHRLEEDMDPTQTYYSDQEFMVGDEIGKITDVVPMLTDSVLVDSVLFAAQMRIHLDTLLGQELLDTAVLSSTADFQDVFKGIRISPAATNNAMLRFDFESPDTRIIMYFTETDTIPSVVDPDVDSTVFIRRFFSLIINSQAAKTLNFNHDFTTGVVQDFIDKTISTPDSLVFLQAMEGLDAQVSFPFAKDLDNIIVNKAELIVTVADTSDISTFPLPSQLVVTEMSDDGEKVLIEDVIASFDLASGVDDSFRVFGGQPVLESDGTLFFYRYHINITGHFQEIIDDVSEDRIFISIFPKEEIADHLILGGGGHSVFGMKLKLTYTKL